MYRYFLYFVVYLEATLLSTVSSNDHRQRAHEWKAGRGTEKKHPKRKLQVLSQTLTCQQQAPFCQTDLVFAIPAHVDLQKCCCHLLCTMIHSSVTHCVFLGCKAKSISTSSGGSNCITLQKAAALEGAGRFTKTFRLQ